VQPAVYSVGLPTGALT